jgi:hypothetical protein
MNRVHVSTLVLAFMLILWSTPVSAVTVSFKEEVSFINFTEIPRDVSVSVDVAACPVPETVAAAPPCVRRILMNPEFEASIVGRCERDATVLGRGCVTGAGQAVARVCRTFNSPSTAR